MNREYGFTLIEMMVALMIFAIVGLLTTMSLRATVQSNHRVMQTDQQLQQLQMIMALLRRDISHNVMPPKINVTHGYSLDLIVGLHGEKVQYVYQNHALFRVMNDVSLPLLQNVISCQWQLNKNHVINHEMPAAVLMVITVSNIGTIEGVFPVIAEGFDAA